jgi:hypothetical protein
MAQAPHQPRGNLAPFVQQIVSDPKNVPDVILLTGYLGASSEEGCERLYLSPDLSSYVEIPGAAILHRAALPTEQDSNGGVTLWVRKDAALQYKMAPAAQALANYFAGAIQAWAQGAPGGTGAAVGPRATIGVHCATFNCSLHCATEITPCINTHANTCFCPVTHACPSQNQLCQSQGACTYVGCGASLACTYGLLCAAAAPAAQAGPGATFAACGAAVGAQAGLGGTTEITPCINTHAVACEHPVTALCRSNACQSPNVCTLGNQPGCQSAGCQSFAQVVCRDLQAVTFGGPACGVTLPNVCQIASAACTVAGPGCQSVYAGTCFLQCHPTRFQPQCPYPSEICTLPPGCQVTNAVNCPVTSGQACPQVSLACPQQSLACGGFPGQQALGTPVAQMQAYYARVGAVQTPVGGSYAPGCWYSYNACPSMICQPHGTYHTPCCPI